MVGLKPQIFFFCWKKTNESVKVLKTFQQATASLFALSQRGQGHLRRTWCCCFTACSYCIPVCANVNVLCLDMWSDGHLKASLLGTAFCIHLRRPGRQWGCGYCSIINQLLAHVFVVNVSNPDRTHVLPSGHNQSEQFYTSVSSEVFLISLCFSWGATWPNADLTQWRPSCADEQLLGMSLSFCSKTRPSAFCADADKGHMRLAVWNLTCLLLLCAYLCFCLKTSVHQLVTGTTVIKLTLF